MTAMKRSGLSCVLAILAIFTVGCGGAREGANADTATGGAASDLAGRIQIDGSSTVGPYATAAAERFRTASPGVQVTVGVSGTGGGFERFCAGETDISNASRPIKDEEREACKNKGIEFVELQVANDALTVVVNRDNGWVDCLTVPQLKKIWDQGSKVRTWKDVDPSWPAERLRLYGPGTDSGTFDYFTDEINGEEGRSRSDYSASEDDNVIVQGVSGDRGALGYFGLSYFEQNKETLKALAIDGGDGCVEPTVESAQQGTYKPLSRPLFIYVKNDALARAEVRAFLEFLFANEREIAASSQFVPLTDEQLQQGKDALAAAG
jgi:phosphate transport system substrate-binding protein